MALAGAYRCRPVTREWVKPTMQIFLGFVVLVLAGAVVLLFAMVGELASRIPDTSQRVRSTEVMPVEGARLGSEPASWPKELARFATAEQGVVLVLSTVCATCEDVASQLSAELDAGRFTDIGVLVSTGERTHGEDFVKRHGLDRVSCHIDELGTWVSGETGVSMSPVALVFREGRLESALSFADLSAVKAATSRMKEAA